MMVKRTNILLMRFLLAWVAMNVAGCRKEAAPPPVPPPPMVSVTHPILRDVVDWDSYSGYLSAPQTANVAARVSGLIVESPFHEGSIVHEGDALFVIDPRPFQADFDNKKAAVAQAMAQAHQDQVHFQRYAKLRGTQAISQDDYDAAEAAAEESQAAVAAAQAAMETSQLNLQWSRVTAPITGRISRIDVTVGNLVNGGSGQVTPLTTIVSTDPLYCYVPVPEGAYLKYSSLLRLEQEQGQPDAQIPCFLDIEDHKPIPGHLDFIDNSVAADTGTVQVRGVFHNPGWLLPGLYASVRIPQGKAHPALLVPATAMVIEQDHRSLLVVGDDNVVHERNVQFGRGFGRLQSVLAGLTVQDWVIVNGLQQARPESRIAPRQIPISAEDLQSLEVAQQAPPALAATQPSVQEEPR